MWKSILSVTSIKNLSEQINFPNRYGFRNYGKKQCKVTISKGYFKSINTKKPIQRCIGFYMNKQLAPPTSLDFDQFPKMGSRINNKGYFPQIWYR